MNDPGLDDQIGSDATALEKKHFDEEEEAEEEEQAFLAPSRWWFASTAFPLIAGTFGPMASTFSICALVVPWRMEIPPGGSEQDGILISDPEWLIGVNAAQLTIAIISNLSLLLNMAKRVRFSIAQPITIMGWYISSFALIALTATAAGPLRITDPTSKYVFSQAFYYAIISAGLYFVVASLMVVTVYGAHTGHYDKDFKLTISQRTLMLQTISFMVYLLSGAAVYSRIEGWNYLDAVYFADFTLLTVGIGDFSPSTNTGRGLLFPFAIGGIIILGLVIGSIRSLVLERGKVKMEARMVEKERERIINHLQKNKPDVLLPSEENERQHREEEFHIMRKIEKRANKRRQWMSLIISGTTWLVLWFAGAAIFQVSEFDQAWSYFDSLYFSYTSLLTIGYGDISPESNSGKPFFVFWSLLAIPSLTVLISNMGDTIVKGIRDLTLWIGELTVLPGEKGVRAGLKNAVHQFTKGKFFDDEIKEQPPGFLGQGPKQENANESDIGNDMNKNDPESAAQRVEGERAKAETEAAKKRGRYGDKLPKNRKHYHCILIEEIGNVMNHLNSSPPRKYDFDEWAWYLKLIGEDESSPVTHRAAPRNLKQGEHGLTIETTTGEKNKGNKTFEWSWIGNRSPLMGNKEEAKWVLERLTKTLRRELEDIRREESEGTGDWAKGGKMREGIMNNRE